MKPDIDLINNQADGTEDRAFESILADVIELVSDGGTGALLKDTLEGRSDTELANILESLPVEYRIVLFAHVNTDRLWPVAKELFPETAKNLIRSSEDSIKLAIQARITSGEVKTYAVSLPESMVDAILLDQDEATLRSLQEALSYEDTQVGRHLNTGIVRVRPTVSTNSLASRIKKRVNVHGVYVVNEDNEILGQVAIDTALMPTDGDTVADVMKPVVAFDHESQFTDILQMIHPDDQLAWYPVVKDGNLIGCFPVSAILWELQDSILMNSVTESPSTEEDLFTPIPKAAKVRAIWLVINLGTALMASVVIGLFEVTLQEVVALAILMPVVASMGGIAGSQTLAVSLRGLALNHISSSNLDLLLKKENKIAVINGACIGLLISIIVAWWFGSFMLGFVIFVAILLNSLAAASSGTMIPFWLNKMNIDPAISGAVILTTVTDIVGFFVFLGLGTLFLVG